MIDRISNREGTSPEFIQAVKEVAESLKKVFEEEPEYMKVFEVMAEPERVVMFRVPWEDDSGRIQVNRGFRVQFSSVLGPYKGGLRFHPSVNLSILKFLGFEQVFKNSLTGLPMGGGKGGSDFDPKGKSDKEVARFCQSFMLELSRMIGPDTDVPAGDIGVGGREIGYMAGQYRRIRNESSCVLTGKNPKWGGSRIRPEATGYGTVYFVQEWYKSKGSCMKDKRCIVSGSGNVAQYTIEKLIQLGAKPMTCCDSAGSIYDPAGFDAEKVQHIMELKNVKRARISEYVEKYPTATYFAGKSVWQLTTTDMPGGFECAFPCATQNEIDGEGAKLLESHGVKIVAEGANMPSTDEACHLYKSLNIVHCPGKAANAGGVAVSGLEMSQNSMRLRWESHEVDAKLHQIMKGIFENCVLYGAKYGWGEDDLVTGANVAGFLKVADSMQEFGWA